MMAIVLAHLSNYYDMGNVKHVLRIGTPLFFLMSGFLYGQRRIAHWSSFYFRRWKTLILPVYIWIIIVGVVCYLCLNVKFTVWQYVTHVFNLAGLPDFSYTALRITLRLGGTVISMNGMGHLWFMTYLMVCLFLVPLLQIIRDKFSESRFWYYGWVPVCIMFMVCCFGYYCGLSLWYIGIFVIGYYVNKNLIPDSIKGLCIGGCVILIGGVCLIVGHWWMGTTDIYKHGAYQVFQTMIVCGTLGIVQYFFRAFPQMKGLPDVGNYTYCVYIVHYVFLVGLLSVMEPFKGQPWIAVPLYIVVILLAALCLQKITRFIENMLFNRTRVRL